MKKLLCVLLCFVFVLGLTACDSDKEEHERYELAQNVIPDDREVKIIDEDGKVWLESKHIEKVYISYEESKGRYLELKLTEDGIDAFKKAYKKKDGNLSIVLKDETLATPVTKHEEYDYSAIVIGEYEYIMNCFNAIT